MNQQSITVNRTLVGVIGVLLLIAAAILGWVGSDHGQDMWAGACLKVGLVMSAFWLALPSISRSEVLGRVTWGALIAAIALALVIGRIRVPLNIVVPVAIGFFVLIRVLGPRRRPPT